MVGMALWWWDGLALQSGHAALAVASVQRDRGRPAVRCHRVDLWPLAIDSRGIPEEFWRKKEETERFLDPFADSRLTDLLSEHFRV